jgi:hypothetical protein
VTIRDANKVDIEELTVDPCMVLSHLSNAYNASLDLLHVSFLRPLDGCGGNGV